MQYRIRKQFSATKVFDGDECVATFPIADNGAAALGAFLGGCSATRISVFDEDRNQFIVGTVGEMVEKRSA
jgi:hypothetical protein